MFMITPIKQSSRVSPLVMYTAKLEFNTLLLLQKCVGAQDWELSREAAMRFLRDPYNALARHCL